MRFRGFKQSRFGFRRVYGSHRQSDALTFPYLLSIVANVDSSLDATPHSISYGATALGLVADVLRLLQFFSVPDTCISVE